MLLQKDSSRDAEGGILPPRPAKAGAYGNNEKRFAF
jgi:hypothetical protein